MEIERALLDALYRHLGLRYNLTPCDDCHSMGTWPDGGDCPTCNGSTVVVDIKETNND